MTNRESLFVDWGLVPDHTIPDLNSTSSSTKVMHIDDYEFGRITIDGEVFRKDVVIFPDHVQSNWWRREGHELHPDDIQSILDARPELLIVGKGYYGRLKVLDSAKKKFEEIGCELIAMNTKKACTLYNERASEKKTIAAFHLTC